MCRYLCLQGDGWEDLPPLAGEQKAKGRPRLYGDKMVMGDVAHLDFVGEKDAVKVYTAIVNCVTLKRNIRIVYLRRKNAYAVLFSTDTALSECWIGKSREL